MCLKQPACVGCTPQLTMYKKIPPEVVRQFWATGGTTDAALRGGCSAAEKGCGHSIHIQSQHQTVSTNIYNSDHISQMCPAGPCLHHGCTPVYAPCPSTTAFQPNT